VEDLLIMRLDILKNLSILDSIEYWEFELLMFQLVDLQRLAFVTAVEIIAGQPAVGH